MTVGENMKKAAGVLLINDKNEILVFFRAKDNYEGAGIPGGKVEPDESRMQAAIRECEEETGIIVKEVFYQPFVEVDPIGKYEFSTYLVTKYSGEIVNNRPEEGLAKWGTIKDLTNGPFKEYNTRMLNHFGVI